MFPCISEALPAIRLLIGSSDKMRLCSSFSSSCRHLLLSSVAHSQPFLLIHAFHILTKAPSLLSSLHTRHNHQAVASYIFCFAIATTIVVIQKPRASVLLLLTPRPSPLNNICCGEGARASPVIVVVATRLDIGSRTHNSIKEAEGGRLRQGCFRTATIQPYHNCGCLICFSLSPRTHTEKYIQESLWVCSL